MSTESVSAAIHALHKPEPADVGCESETWSGDHYGDAFDLYWIRCTRLGRHDPHSESGNTGCTWPLDETDRHTQARIPMVCEVDGEDYPCQTIRALAPTRTVHPAGAADTHTTGAGA